VVGRERQEVILDTLKPFERLLRDHVSQRHAEAEAMDATDKQRRKAFIRASEGGEILTKVRALMKHLLEKEGLL
jgi:hypothetical protein